MCGSMVDFQSVTAEIRIGIKEERKKEARRNYENIMSTSATQGGHKKLPPFYGPQCTYIHGYS